MSPELPQLSVVLLHYPVYNKTRDVIATSLTTLNLHDLARVTTTYGVAGCYVVTPLERQRALAQQMLAHWTHGYGATYNPTRAVALHDIQIMDTLAAVEDAMVQRYGCAPQLIATDARQFAPCITYPALRELLWHARTPFLLLLGTGWGLAEELMARCDYILAPIYGPTSYNHLPVRVAAGIILDRLMACPEMIHGYHPVVPAS